MGMKSYPTTETLLCQMFPEMKFFVQNYFNGVWHTYPPGFEFAGDAKCFAIDHHEHDRQPMRVIQLLEDGKYAKILQNYGVTEEEI